MDKKLITEINRIREIISGKNILLEQPVPPKLSQEIFDFALRQGDEFIDFVRPLAEKEAQRIGAATDDLIDIFTKQIDDFDSGFSTVKQFSDDSIKLILRNATTEEFVEFLIKSKIIPSSIDNEASIVIKKVAELGRKGTPASEEYIEGSVKVYEDSLESLDWLSDEIKQGLISRYRKQLNQVRTPSLAKVGLDVTPEAVLRNVLGEDTLVQLQKSEYFRPMLKSIETRLGGKTWEEAIDDAVSRIDLLKTDEKYKNALDKLTPQQAKLLNSTFNRVKEMLLVYRREKGFGGEKVFIKGPSGSNIINIPRTLTRIASSLAVLLMFVEFMWFLITKGTVTGLTWFFVEKIGALVGGFTGGTKDIRERFSKVSEEEAKNYMTKDMDVDISNYSFEVDPKDPLKMIGLWVGEGDGVDYLIYKDNAVLGHKVYTEEDRNKSLLDIFKF